MSHVLTKTYVYFIGEGKNVAIKLNYACLFISMNYRGGYKLSLYLKKKIGKFTLEFMIVVLSGERSNDVERLNDKVAS